MNKLLIYSVIAILLGSVTMIVPFGLLELNNGIDDTYTDDIPGSGGETIQRDGVLPGPDAPSDQYADIEGSDASETESAADKPNSKGTNVVNNLSSIGLITITSFLIALGVSIYLKNR
jgi:hypothetical protein